jgi:hypothetical protein
MRRFISAGHTVAQLLKTYAREIECAKNKPAIREALSLEALPSRYPEGSRSPRFLRLGSRLRRLCTLRVRKHSVRLL